MARTPEVPSVIPDAAPRFSVRHRIILLVAVLGAAAAALGLTVVPSLPGPDSALDLPWIAWVAAFALSRGPGRARPAAAGLALLLADRPGPRRRPLPPRAGRPDHRPGRRRRAGLRAPPPAVRPQARLQPRAVRARRLPGHHRLHRPRARHRAVGRLGLGRRAGRGRRLDAHRLRLHLRRHAGVRGVPDDRASCPACSGLSLPFALGVAAVGLLAADTAAQNPASLVLLALPSGLLIAAYRAYAKAREQQNNLRLLHEITSLLYNSDDAPTALTDFLTAVRGAFRAASAELVLFGEGDALPTLSRSRDGEKPVALQLLERREDADRLVAWATENDALTARTGTEPRLRTGPLRRAARAEGRDGVGADHRGPRPGPAARDRPARGTSARSPAATWPCWRPSPGTWRPRWTAAGWRPTSGGSSSCRRSCVTRPCTTR